MPVLESNNYFPNLLHRNGHLGTLLPHIFYHKKFEYKSRSRIKTFDDDFLDVDLYQTGKNKAFILCHGLEGSSSSNYVTNMASLLIEYGYDIIAVNYRGCSGEMNNALRLYHSGATDDIDLVVGQYQGQYKTLGLLGFSLGANMVLKYAGEEEFKKPESLKVVIGISAPNDLSLCSDQISKKSNYIYEKRFLISLYQKLKAKAKQFPGEIDLSKLKEANTIRNFDELYTGPLHGFKGAEHYYSMNSSKQFLEGIRIPCLIINALNDPFLHKLSHPFQEAKASEYVHLLAPNYGGHVGFRGNGGNISWSERESIDFINKYIPI